MHPFKKVFACWSLTRFSLFSYREYETELSHLFEKVIIHNTKIYISWVVCVFSSRHVPQPWADLQYRDHSCSP